MAGDCDDPAGVALAAGGVALASGASFAHCFSSTCGISLLARKASAAIGTATRNTVWIEPRNRPRSPRAPPAGRWLSVAGVASALLKPDGSATPCRWLARLPASTLEKIAPKIAVPNDPPIDRKNVAPGGRDAQLAVRHAVLHDDDQHLHDAADAHAEHEHVRRRP